MPGEGGHCGQSITPASLVVLTWDPHWTHVLGILMGTFPLLWPCCSWSKALTRPQWSPKLRLKDHRSHMSQTHAQPLLVKLNHLAKGLGLDCSLAMKEHTLDWLLPTPHYPLEPGTNSAKLSSSRVTPYSFMSQIQPYTFNTNAHSFGNWASLRILHLSIQAASVLSRFCLIRHHKLISPMWGRLSDRRNLSDLPD